MKLKDEKKQALMARKNRNLIFSALIWMGGAFFAGGFFLSFGNPQLFSPQTEAALGWAAMAMGLADMIAGAILKSRGE